MKWQMGKNDESVFLEQRSIYVVLPMLTKTGTQLFENVFGMFNAVGLDQNVGSPQRTGAASSVKWLRGLLRSCYQTLLHLLAAFLEIAGVLQSLYLCRTTWHPKQPVIMPELHRLNL